MIVYTPVGPGELIDRITILEIECERVAARDKLAREKVARARADLAKLAAVRNGAVPRSPELDRLTAALKNVNQTLWWVEDGLRDHERHADFGPSFVALARSVHPLKDQRAGLKRRIDELLAAASVEEKIYAAY
jgi:hypothetical protein